MAGGGSKCWWWGSRSNFLWGSMRRDGDVGEWDAMEEEAMDREEARLNAAPCIGHGGPSIYGPSPGTFVGSGVVNMFIC